MFTKGFHLTLEKEDIEPFMRHYTKVQKIKQLCWGEPGEGGKERMPSCHEVALAYEKAFGPSAAHGRKFFFTSIKKFRWIDFFSGNISNYVHSWNIVTLPSGKQMILDIFPDETCSIAPIILSHPHPAYVGGNKNVTDLVEREMQRPESIATIDYFAAEFMEVAKG